MSEQIEKRIVVRRGRRIGDGAPQYAKVVTSPWHRSVEIMTSTDAADATSLDLRVAGSVAHLLDLLFPSGGPWACEP